ncbi:hypothetical protein PR003_g14969 [Phytophthora rubi]|uniref:Uncharacterized protein n=1 Tax=Phytophthora rubi TaxID=129364 RepID=A0A6A4EXT5_9STRA|nr:hypothetical protein PR003_g14969 [Phytophthora rubi]
MFHFLRTWSLLLVDLKTTFYTGCNKTVNSGTSSVRQLRSFFRASKKSAVSGLLRRIEPARVTFASSFRRGCDSMCFITVCILAIRFIAVCICMLFNVLRSINFLMGTLRVVDKACIILERGCSLTCNS